MATIAAARSALRSAATRSRRFAANPKTPSPSPFGISSPKPSSPRILRSPVAMSCSLLPYHTATATSLLNSMLSVAPMAYGWTIQDCNDDE